MKLNQYKIGLYSTVFLIAIALVASLGVGVFAEVHNIDADEFEDKTGSGKWNLSDDFSEGDTINFDFDEATQTHSVVVDLEGITINGREDTSIYVNSGAGNSLKLLECGAKINNLHFRPEGQGLNAAIQVDFANACCCNQPQLELTNLVIGWGSGDCDPSEGNFVDGIQFINGGPDGSSLDYMNIVFDEIETRCGILRHGIYFSPGDPASGVDDGVNNPGDIEDVFGLNFTNLQLQSCGAGNEIGAGIKFANQGELRDISVKESEEGDYGIYDNDHGIWIDGYNEADTNGFKEGGVTRINDFEVEDVDLRNNNINGFYIQPGTGMDTIENVYFESSHIVENGEYGVKFGDVVLDSNRLGATMSEIKFEEVVVRDNPSGGVLLTAADVGYPGSTAPDGLRVLDSRFNDKQPTQMENDQDHGLTVLAAGGIRHVVIKNSTFHDHAGEVGTGADKISGGINLGAIGYQPIESFDGPVQDVLIENSSASYNVNSEDGSQANGLLIQGKSVTEVAVKVTEEDGTYTFRENSRNGILIEGAISVDNITVADEDGDGSRDLVLDQNGTSDAGGNGLSIFGNTGNIGNVSVAWATFDENEGEGVVLNTDTSGDIKEISFSNVTANGNKDGSGLAIRSADGFENSSETVLIDPSQFNGNQDYGFVLTANNSIVNPIIKDSEFKDNNGNDNQNGAGIKLDAGDSPGDELSGAVVENNVVLNNYNGIEMQAWKVIDAEVKANDEISGNGPKNILIDGDNLQDISVVKNSLINDVGDGEYGLFLEAGGTGTSADIEVSENKFASGIDAPCGGLGTAIQLNARDASIHHNEFVRFDPTIVVTQESSNSPSGPEETSNHINNNNFDGCCHTIKALLGTNQKVDATENYFGEGVSEAFVRSTLAGDTEKIYILPIREQRVPIFEEEELEVKITPVPEEPGVNETVELKYELKNTTGSDIDVSEVLLSITDPDDELVEDEKQLKTDVTVEGNSSKTYTTEFTFTKSGEYQIEIKADEYTGTLTLPVGVVEPEEKQPYWGKGADKPATSGILPAPINGSDDPFLVLANTDGDSVEGYVTVNAVRVYDRTGKMLMEITSDFFTSMTQLENLNEDLYLYTVQYTLDGTEKSSPPMKFVVDKP